MFKPRQVELAQLKGSAHRRGPCLGGAAVRKLVIGVFSC